MWHAWGRGDVFRRFWLGGLKVRDHWEDLGLCEYGNEPSDSIGRRDIFDKLSDSQLFK
jgi:hypothetical protein